MKLKKYSEKRTLLTPEPEAKIYKRKSTSLQFVVQKHAASHLHYDFRLEVNGVLKSWAVPKGPSLDPNIKRLAMMVEDHPFDYREFEGIIPQGYGAGTVMIWDRGTYSSVEDVSSIQSEKLIQEGINQGHFHFILHGEKLKGEFILIKMNRGKENEWLLMKKKDLYSTKEDVLKLDRSVVSEKTLEEIAGESLPHLKGGVKSVAKTQVKAVQAEQLKTAQVKTETKRKSSKTHSQSANQAPLPMGHSFKPMLATLTDKSFNDPNWIFEIKLDGFRAIAEINGTQVDLYSRNLISFASRFPQVVEALKSLQLNAVLDGEIVGLDSKGVSHFQLLQNLEMNQSVIYFYVFDLLYVNGEDIRHLPIVERKRRLKALLNPSKNPSKRVRYLDFIEEQGKDFYHLCESKGLEGIIAKKKTSLYHSGDRSKEWLKVKIQMRQEVIICGYTEPKRSRKNFGALIVGVHEGKELRYAGHVGGGFDAKQLKEMKELLEKDVVEKSVFKNPPKTNTPVSWVKPKYICEVEFKEWTDEGVMRQPIFLGLRSDKAPRRITKEEKVPLNEIKVEKKTKNPKKPSSNAPTTELEHFSFITHPEKIYYEKDKITKGDVLEYYRSVSNLILPYLKNRPEILKRFPNGISKPSFYQKNLETHPDWVHTVPIQHEDRTVEYLMISDLPSLLYAVNLGCIEIHTWFSCYPRIDYPDFMIFDLDPEAISFNAVIDTALVLHDILDHLKIPNFCKTSGATGLHIGVPLGALYTFEQSKNLALVIAKLAHQQLPKTTSLERSPKDRQRKVYLDCLQNNFGQGIAVPFSLRARPGAPVSMPLDWKEVKRGIQPTDYNLFNLKEHMGPKKDPFKGVLQKGIHLENILSKIKKSFSY